MTLNPKITPLNLPPFSGNQEFDNQISFFWHGSVSVGAILKRKKMWVQILFRPMKFFHGFLTLSHQNGCKFKLVQFVLSSIKQNLKMNTL